MKSPFESVQINVSYHVSTTYKVRIWDLPDISAFQLDTVKKTCYMIQFFDVCKTRWKRIYWRFLRSLITNLRSELQNSLQRITNILPRLPPNFFIIDSEMLGSLVMNFLKSDYRFVIGDIKNIYLPPVPKFRLPGGAHLENVLIWFF